MTMASERHNETWTAHHAGITPDGQAPWTDLEVTIPTDRNHASVVALVECALVELITQLTRSPSTPAERSSKGVAKEPDTFVVKPVRELRTP